MKITKMEMKMSETINSSRIQQMRNNVGKRLDNLQSQNDSYIYVIWEKKKSVVTL
jgi:hypothetical protein